MNASNFVSLDRIQRRYGACQHCGWNDSLQKVTRHQAVEMSRNAHSLRPGFRWICDGCMSDLGGARQKSQVTVGSGRGSLVSTSLAGHRSVA
jgi:hypothetical protein